MICLLGLWSEWVDEAIEMHTGEREQYSTRRCPDVFMWNYTLL